MSPCRRGRLVDAADQLFDLDGVRAEFSGKLVQIRRGDPDKARLVDVGDDLDADCLELADRLVLQLERLGRLVFVDLGGRCLHPLLLLGGEALPELVADPDKAVIGFVFGEREHRCHFVMLIDEIDIDTVFGDIDDTGL